MSWSDAQHYCRVKYTDLATFENMDDISRLKRLGLKTSESWIGLTDDPKSWIGTMGNDANSWTWSATGETSKTGYHNWSPGFPNNRGGNQLCGFSTNKGKWDDWACDSRLYFICFQDTNPPGQKTYTRIEKWMNWTDAQAYCRTHYTDLAMMENDQENTLMMSVQPNFDWIGLYREGWRWSDKSDSSFRNWMNGQPDNNGNQYCVAEKSNHLWLDDSCNVEKHFWCHEVPSVKTIVKMKIQTDADLSDPDVNIQILDQMDEMLRNKGLTDFKLRWKIQPRKEEEEDKDEDKCPVAS
ncbi:putative C-type lectin domain family 20 member A isoform X1 [Amphiprion ocellaris]|nr:putative C-type lectin domain family 20 member A isoform X1 [Amphiprion ocellaris]